MKRHVLLASILLPFLSPPTAESAAPCACRFEVSAPSGTIRPVRRATATAKSRTCSFDVRVRVDPREAGACDGATAMLRGLGSTETAVDPWAMSWERVTLRARKQGIRRRTLRARIHGTNGAVGRAHLALR